MNNRKGLILSEVLAVIVVITVVFVIVMMTFFTIFDKNKSKLRHDQELFFIKSAKMYIASTYDIVIKNIYEIPLSKLINKKLITKKKYINAKSGKEYDLNSTVMVKNNQGIFDYKFVEAYTQDNLIYNLDGYYKVDELCNYLICGSGSYNEKDFIYNLESLNYIFKNNNTISIYGIVTDEINNINYNITNDSLYILKEDTANQIINKLVAIDIIKNDKNIEVYLNGNYIYYNNDSLFNNLKLNGIDVYNIRVYNKSLSREDVLKNYEISKERYEYAY